MIQNLLPPWLDPTLSMPVELVIRTQQRTSTASKWSNVEKPGLWKTTTAAQLMIHPWLTGLVGQPYLSARFPFTVHGIVVCCNLICAYYDGLKPRTPRRHRLAIFVVAHLADILQHQELSHLKHLTSTSQTCSCFLPGKTEHCEPVSVRWCGP